MIEPGALGAAVEEDDDARRIAVRRRLQDDRAHDAENRGVRADAEGERDDGRGREAGRPEQEAHGVAHVAGDRARDRHAGRRRGRSVALEPGGDSPRPIGASDLRGDPDGIVQRRERQRDGVGLRHTRREQVRVVFGDVLRELVDDVRIAHGVHGHGADARAHERFPVVHQRSLNGT